MSAVLEQSSSNLNQIVETKKSLRERVNDFLTAELVLDYLLIDTGKREVFGNIIRVFCPIHGGEIFKSMGIDTERKQFKCHYNLCPGYTGGDLLALYSLATRTSPGESIQYWQKELGLEDIISNSMGELEHEILNPSSQDNLPFVIEESGKEVPIQKLPDKNATESIMEQIQREVHRTLRYKRKMGLVLLQVTYPDKTEQTINPVSKEAFIQRISQLIARSIRVSDAWAYYCESRIILVFPETNKPKTESGARRLKSKILKHFESHPEESIMDVSELADALQLSVSGIFTNQFDTTAEKLINQAEQNLKSF